MVASPLPKATSNERADVTKGLKPLIPAQLDAMCRRQYLAQRIGGDRQDSGFDRAGYPPVVGRRREPENLLCITFTKAGAAEMAERINQLLAAWVQMDDNLCSRSGGDRRRFNPEARQGQPAICQSFGCAGRWIADHDDPQLLPIAAGQFPRRGGADSRLQTRRRSRTAAAFREALSEMIIAAEERGDKTLIEDLQSLSLEWVKMRR